MRHMLHSILVIVGLQLALVSSVQAFGVGDIAVYSRRGEPLAAEIRLLLEPQERGKGIEVTLASQAAYQAEGLKRPALIDVLTAVVADTRDVIRLSSQVSIQEPHVSLLLEVRLGQVTVVKHYHVNLPASGPVVSRPLTPLLPTIAQVAPAMRQAKAAPKQARRPQARPDRYGPVERGETLYSVARSLVSSPSKVWQAVVLLWQANKGQFMAGNLHGLQVGTYLDIPHDLSETSAAMRLAEAQDIVAGHWEEWQALQRLGAGKQRLVAAAPRDPEAAVAAYGPRESADRRDGTPQPTDKATEKSDPQAIVLPVGKPGHMVSMTELQNVLQGLEERLMRRLTPTTSQEFKATTPSTTGFVSASDLQASIQNLEERLTQRLQQMLLQSQTPEPVRVGQRALQLSQTPPAGFDMSQPAALTLIPYLLVLTNVLLLVLVGALLWFWLRRRDRVARMQRV